MLVIRNGVALEVKNRWKTRKLRIEFARYYTATRGNTRGDVKSLNSN